MYVCAHTAVHAITVRKEALNLVGRGEAYRKVWVEERGRNAVIIISEIS